MAGEPQDYKKLYKTDEYDQWVADNHADNMSAQRTLKSTGHYRGPVDGDWGSDNSNPSVKALQSFSREFQTLADKNGHQTGAPGYGPKVQAAMDAGRPEGKINLPPGMTQQRAEALYKAASELSEFSQRERSWEMQPPQQPFSQEEIQKIVTEMRASNYLGTISNPKFWQNYDKNTEEFKKNYSINSRSDTPEVGDARSRESMSAERVRIYQEAEKSGQTIGGTPYVPSRYANAEQIRADQLDALRQKTGQNIQDPALGQSQNLSAQEGAAILWGNRSPEETKHLYQQAVTPEGFGTIPYNPANPTTALNEMTKNAGGQWQMRDEGVLAEANGPYAVGTFKTETQRQQAVEALTSAGVLTLNGKQDDKAAIFIAGDELKNMTPEQLGTVQAILDEENKIQKGPALESRPITPSGPVGPSGP